MPPLFLRKYVVSLFHVPVPPVAKAYRCMWVSCTGSRRDNQCRQARIARSSPIRTKWSRRQMVRYVKPNKCGTCRRWREGGGSWFIKVDVAFSLSTDEDHLQYVSVEEKQCIQYIPRKSSNAKYDSCSIIHYAMTLLVQPTDRPPTDHSRTAEIHIWKICKMDSAIQTRAKENKMSRNVDGRFDLSLIDLGGFEKIQVWFLWFFL